jgi:hypothetical protein
MRRLNCRTVRELLPLHCGGDLPPEKAVAVDLHLHACLVCFREYRDFAAMRGRLGVLAEEPLPAGALDGFTEDVMARLVVGEEGPVAQLPSRNRWLQLDAPVLRVAAAAALLLAVGFGVWQADLVPGLRSSGQRSLRDPLGPGSFASRELAAPEQRALEGLPTEEQRPGPGRLVEARPSYGQARAASLTEPVAPAAAPPMIVVDPEHMPAVLMQIPIESLQSGLRLELRPADEGLHPESGRTRRPREQN